MVSPYTCTTQSTVERFLDSIIHLELEDPKPEIRKGLFDILKLLDYSGCDFYDLLPLYIQMDNWKEAELLILLSYAPQPQATYLPDQRHIRQCIPRWTASKYHTSSIAEVLSQIEQTIHTGLSGLYTYNSNLNPYSRRSLNDLYVLVIAEGSTRWFDINRKSTYAFAQTERKP